MSGLKYEEEFAVLADVSAAVKKDPSMLTKIIMTATHAIEDSVREARDRQIDFEVIAATAIGMLGEKRVSPQAREHFNKLVINKLVKHKDTSFCTFEWAYNKKEPQDE